MPNLLDVIRSLLSPSDELSRGQAGTPTGSAMDLLMFPRVTPGGGNRLAMAGTPMPDEAPVPSARPDPWAGMREPTSQPDPMQTASVPQRPATAANPYNAWQRGMGSSDDMPMPGQGRRVVGGGGRSAVAGGSGSDRLQGASSGGGIGGFLGGLFGQGPAAQQKLAAQYLQRQGMDEGMAMLVARDPQLLRAVVGRSLSGGGEGFTLSPGQVRYDAQGNVLARGGNEDEDLPEAVQKYLFAVKQGYEGSFTDWETKGIREQDPTFSREMDLRKEYDLLPEVKDYKVVRSNFERIRQGVQLGTGAGDAAIVFGYMKMLDPTSVVREGEQATARNAAGVPESIRGMYNQLIGGGMISPEARNQILGAAEKVYGEASANIEDLNKRYGAFASKYKLNPDDIVSPVERYDPLEQQPNAAAPGASGRPRATNPQTGESVEWDGTQWVPANGR